MDLREEHSEKPKKVFHEILQKVLPDSDSEIDDRYTGISFSPRSEYHISWGNQVIYSPEIVDSEPPTPPPDPFDTEVYAEYAETFDDNHIPLLDRHDNDSDDESDEEEDDDLSDASDDSSSSKCSTVSDQPSSKQRSTRRNRSRRIASPGRLWRVSNLTSGALAFALLPAQYRTPWWPAVVIDSTAVLMKTKKGRDVVAYRIMLICPPSHLVFNGSFYVKERNLRTPKTERDLDEFMKACISVAHKRYYYIAQFQIPFSQEFYWIRAKRIYFLMEPSPATNLAERMLQLGLSLPEYQKIWEEEDNTRQEVLIPLGDVEIVSQRNANAHVKTLSGRQVTTLPRDGYAYEDLLHVFTGRPSAMFICSECLEPGWYEKKQQKRDDCEENDPQQREENNFNIDNTVLGRSCPLTNDHVKIYSKSQAIMARSLAKSDFSLCARPLVKCSNNCPRFIHESCLSQYDASEEPFCRFCLAQVNQCSHCLEMEPMFNGRRVDVSVLGICSRSTCFRRIHRNTCLRLPIYEYLARGGRRDEFICPAHSCLTCYTEKRGIWSYATRFFFSCALCPSVYHSDEWCIPAGSVWLSRYWFICPRHALARPPQSLLKITPNFSETSESGSKDLNLYERSALRKVLISDAEFSILKYFFRPANTAWCVICGKGGKLVCCEGCPNAFHGKCLSEKSLDEKYYCTSCQRGRVPCYGEIVWVRVPPLKLLQHLNSLNWKFLTPELEFLRHIFPPEDVKEDCKNSIWWPGEILHPRSFHYKHPTKIDQFTQLGLKTRLGFFAVRLFNLKSASPFNAISPADAHKIQSLPINNASGDGTTDPRIFPVCLWTTRARVHYFTLEDVDQELNETCIPPGFEDPDPILELFLSGSSREALGLEVSGSRLKSRSASRRISSGRNSEGNRRPAFNVRKNSVFLEAVQQAGVALSARQKYRESILYSEEDRPAYYVQVKTNVPVGYVKIRAKEDDSINGIEQCSCTEANPCGLDSNCINRICSTNCVNCNVGSLCRNQFFTQRTYPKQELFYTDSRRGWGVRAQQFIPKDEFVNEYVGELIDEAESRRRTDFAKENNVKCTYIMALDQRHVDAGPKGNLSRFYNHSCDPNLSAHIWNVKGDFRIGLFALRDIQVGEELTFNYNSYANGVSMGKCHCGAPNCQGIMGTAKDRPQLSEESEGEDDRDDDASRVREKEARSKTKKKSMNRTKSVARRQNGDTGVKVNGRSSRSTSVDSVPPLPSLTATNSSTNSLPVLAAKKNDNLCPRCNKVVSKILEIGKSGIACNGKNGDFGLVCPRPDCQKTYHIRCLLANRVIDTRWICPMHHCGICGAPGTVFCCLCNVSYCATHVEGSVEVIPPLKLGDHARVICKDHAEMFPSCSQDSNSDTEEAEETPDDIVSLKSKKRTLSLKSILNRKRRRDISVTDRPTATTP